MGFDDDTSRRFLRAFALTVGQRTRLHGAFRCVGRCQLMAHWRNCAASHSKNNPSIIILYWMGGRWYPKKPLRGGCHMHTISRASSIPRILLT